MKKIAVNFHFLVASVVKQEEEEEEEEAREDMPPGLLLQSFIRFGEVQSGESIVAG